MLKRILGLLGWLGVALVFAAVAIKFSKPEWQQYYYGLAIAGLVCTLLYILSQWREIGQAFAGRQARFGTLAVASVLVVLAILAAINYLGTRHNKRWDLTAAKQFSLSDQTRKVLQDLKQPVHIRVFARSDDFERFRDRLDEYTYATKQVTVDYHRSGKEAGAGAAVRRHRAWHGGLRVRRPKREGDVRRRAGADERADQSRPGTPAEGLLRPGPW